MFESLVGKWKIKGSSWWHLGFFCTSTPFTGQTVLLQHLRDARGGEQVQEGCVGLGEDTRGTFFWLKVLPELLGPAQRLETRAWDRDTVYTTNNKLPSFAHGRPLLPPTPFELGFAALQRGPPKSGPLEAVRLSLQGSLPCPGSQRWLHSRSPCPEETETQGGIGMKSRGRRRRRMSPGPQEENTHGFSASSATSCAALGVV